MSKKLKRKEVVALKKKRKEQKRKRMHEILFRKFHDNGFFKNEVKSFPVFDDETIIADWKSHYDYMKNLLFKKF